MSYQSRIDTLTLILLSPRRFVVGKQGTTTAAVIRAGFSYSGLSEDVLWVLLFLFFMLPYQSFIAKNTIKSMAFENVNAYSWNDAGTIEMSHPLCLIIGYCSHDGHHVSVYIRECVTFIEFFSRLATWLKWPWYTPVHYINDIPLNIENKHYISQIVLH